MTKVKQIFMVDDKPFFPFGSELLLQSGYSVRDESEIDEAFKALKLTHGNTGEFPVYWDEVEPEEGKFNFTGVDTLLSFARRYGVKPDKVLQWIRAGELPAEELDVAREPGQVWPGAGGFGIRRPCFGKCAAQLLDGPQACVGLGEVGELARGPGIGPLGGGEIAIGA